ncbi:hypothetical protein KCU62_g37, partial [Aureobasidium sp. EXF-3399]
MRETAAASAALFSLLPSLERVSMARRRQAYVVAKLKDHLDEFELAWLKRAVFHANQEWKNGFLNYQLRISKGFERQMLLMSVMVVNVLSDLGVKRSGPKLNYYLVLDFLIIERGGSAVI